MKLGFSSRIMRATVDTTVVEQSLSLLLLVAILFRAAGRDNSRDHENQQSSTRKEASISRRLSS